MTAITRIGAVGASALLAIGLLAAPPAGASHDNDSGSEHKARAARATCLSGDGKTQGRSMSDPDGMSNGGPDKPGCTDEIDADRDGNNGCGNDADREDDNNGHCGLKDQSPPSGARDTGDSADPSAASTTGESSEPVTDTSEAEDDAEKDDDATTDDATSDSSTESPDESKPLPLNQAGTSIGLLAVLGGIVRLFLRIG